MFGMLALIFTAGLHVTSLTKKPCARGAPICMKQTTRPPAAKGFAAKKKASKPAPVVPLDPSCAAAMLVLEEGERDLEHYLNPAHFADPATMEDITRRLQAGDLVVIKDAFRPEFAEMVFTELSASSVAWELNEAYFPDGYAHLHNNVYERSSWSARLNSTLDMFAAKASRAFISKLTGRDCTGDTTGAPSWYDTGHHSLPHTDWVGQRTVAYVWHLSKNWKPEWGGVSATGLYWAQHDHAVATYPASFNSLVLFIVTTTSAHFVTTVSPHHTGKRLTFNGWYQSAWLPRLDDPLLEEMLSSEEHPRRDSMTHTQLQFLTDQHIFLDRLSAGPWPTESVSKRGWTVMGCAPSKGKARPKLFGLDLTASRSRSRNPQDNELDVSKHIKGEPALEPAPRVDSQSVMSQSLTKVVMQIRGADSRLIKESTVDRTQRLI
eukprot:jgi/Chrpa1/20114/Chrysochromulina_OHIO_Genome00024643-RA